MINLCHIYYIVQTSIGGSYSLTLSLALVDKILLRNCTADFNYFILPKPSGVDLLPNGSNYEMKTHHH
ncbi:hypothetical protein Pint_06404 [Pistacia integerrima]|uniref:Uncharacterized protein n=1 Tax=Pistacia integerrima TaxID=434235 RepID=A0ACC0Z8J1_9ROSI|nr:hypothetical protein Pint_06404 [Pistacia integerrima]